MARRDHTYGSAGDCTITFSMESPEGKIAAPTGSMHLNLATAQVFVKVSGVEKTGWSLSSSGLADGSYGDITVSGGGTMMELNDGVVTYDKIQDMSGPGKVLGRLSPGVGDVEEIPFVLDSLVDVTLTAPAADDLLAFDGAKWINRKQTYVTDGGNF